MGNRGERAVGGAADDRLAIRELLDRYADGVNQRDAEIWASTWAEDSERNMPLVPGLEAVKGKAAIVEGYDEAAVIVLGKAMADLVVKVATGIVTAHHGHTPEIEILGVRSQGHPGLRRPALVSRRQPQQIHARQRPLPRDLRQNRRRLAHRQHDHHPPAG